jgi:hypothetical protein
VFASSAQAATGGAAHTGHTGALAQARHACTAGELSTAQTFVDAAITRRDAALSRMTSALGRATHVTSAHREALGSLFQQDTTGLAQVQTKVNADTTCAAVRADAPAIVHDYYVFALVVPQAGLTVAGDAGTAGAKALMSAEPAVKAAIALMPAGSAKTSAQATYADLVAKVASAAGDFSGVGDAVLALTPATYPTHTGVLKAQSTRVATGGIALRGALVDAQTLAADLA